MTVIGRVDKRYRNYEVLYHAFTRIVPCLNQYRIKLVLLGSSGSSYGRKVIQQFQDLENDFFSFVAFQGFVKQSHFEEYVNQSDFFIIPLVLETRNTIYNEIYGKTKISGSVNDIIHYQKPALISSGYPLEDALKMITEPFTNDKELADKILKWCSEKTYASFDMTKILKEYTQQSIRDHYVNTFEKCLKQARKTKF